MKLNENQIYWVLFTEELVECVLCFLIYELSFQQDLPTELSIDIFCAQEHYEQHWAYLYKFRISLFGGMGAIPWW